MSLLTLGVIAGWLIVEGLLFSGVTILPPLTRHITLGEPFPFQVTQPGAPHAITIFQDFLALECELRGPDGVVLYRSSEQLARMRRKIYFTPAVSGEHTLLVQRRRIGVFRIPYIIYMPLGSLRPTLAIQIDAGDRRVLWPIVYWLFSSYVEGPWEVVRR